MTELISTVPAIEPTKSVNFTVSPEGSPITFAVGADVYVSSAKSVATNTDLTFTAVTDVTDPIRYEWDFGDGSKRSGATIIHSFVAPNPHQQVTLSVTDSAGRRRSVTRQLYLKGAVEPGAAAQPPEANGAGTSWANASAAYSDTDSEASATVTTTTALALELQNFGLDTTIPLGSTITSVKIRVRRRVASAPGVGTAVQGVIWKVGATFRSAWDEVTDNSTAWVVYELDVTADRAWVRDDLLNGTFAVQVRGRVTGGGATNATFNVDWVKVDVEWEPPAPGEENLVKSDTANVVTANYWGPYDEGMEDPSRFQVINTGGDTRNKFDGTPQGDTKFYRLTVQDGDDAFGERAELGYNSWRWGEHVETDVGELNTFAIYREGQHRRTYFSVRLPSDFPISATTFQLVMQMKQTAPSNASGGSPIISLHARAGHWEIWQGYQAAEGSTRLWQGPVANLNVWARFCFDVVYSIDPDIGTIQLTVDNGTATTTSPLFHTYTLKPEVGTSLLLGPGDPIPSHLRMGIYHDPAIAGTSVDIDNVQVVEVTSGTGTVVRF